jgi:HK97 gp10 family phage protein
MRLKAIKTRTPLVRGMVVHTGSAFYGKFHELGTRKMTARPFMRPVFERHVDAMVKTMSDELGSAIVREMQRGIKRRS